MPCLGYVGKVRSVLYALRAGKREPRAVCAQEHHIEQAQPRTRGLKRNEVRHA